MSDPITRLKQLIHEIHGRSLWQVLGIYVVASWAVLGGVGTLGDILGLPDWFPRLALGLLIVGLPVVLATAFVQEGGSPHHEARRDVAVPGPTASRLLTWRNAVLGGAGALSLLLGVGVGWVWFGGNSSPGEQAGAPQRSVAVLPFVNMSGDADNEYFSDGITEELLDALAQLPGVRVPGRTSSFAFKGQNITIQEIADTLHVGHILEGSVRRDAERVRITAQLVEAETDTRLWSDTFERTLDDIFAIQREIASAIADQLRLELSPEAGTTLIADGTHNAEAHQAYLRGRYFWNQRTESSLRSALVHFGRAAELDPTYAEAFSGMADTYFLIDLYVIDADSLDYRSNQENGLAAARRATMLNPDLGMARTSLAFGLFMVGDWSSAQREFQEALRLGPGAAHTHMRYSQFLYSNGRTEEGIAHAEEALARDPVARVMSYNRGHALWLAGRNEEALQQADETISLAPDWGTGWLMRALYLLELGHYEQGLEAWIEYARLSGIDASEADSWYRAATRYRETGVSQPVFDVADPRIVAAIAPLTGQEDLYLDAFRYFIEEGAFGWAAQYHVMWYRGGFLQGSTEYQGLLRRAGITW